MPPNVSTIIFWVRRRRKFKKTFYQKKTKAKKQMACADPLHLQHYPCKKSDCKLTATTTTMPVAATSIVSQISNSPEHEDVSTSQPVSPSWPPENHFTAEEFRPWVESVNEELAARIPWTRSKQSNIDALWKLLEQRKRDREALQVA